jgi:integrase
MLLRVRNGKGAKERVLPLSERLLKELEDYWRAQRKGKAGHDSPWLFLGRKAGQPMPRVTGQHIPVGTLQASVPHIRAEREHVARDSIPSIRRCLQRFDSEAIPQIV